MDVQYLNTVLWFYSLMDTSGSKMDQLYVSELRILKATWRASNHEYVVAIVKDTSVVLAAVTKVVPKGGLKGKYFRTENGGRGGGANADNSKDDDEVLVDQQRAPFERFVTNWQTTSPGLAAFDFSFRDIFVDALAYGLASAPASVFHPLTGERGAEDLVYILNNPWVHERDEVVASLGLPPPSSLSHNAALPAVTPEPDHPKTEFHNSSTSENHGIQYDLSSALPMACPQACDIPFPVHRHRPLFMFELVVLACTLKEAKPEYRVLTSNCYWYCTMILHIVRLRHGLDIIPIRESKSKSLKLFKHVMPSESYFYSVSVPNAHAVVVKEKKNAIKPWRWKSNPRPQQERDVNRGTSVDPIPYPISALCPTTPISTPSPSSSWYKAKMGSWYGIQVSKLPTEAVLRRWLIKTEEAIEQFKNEVYSVRHNRRFVLQDGTVVDMGIRFGSSTREISRLGFIAGFNKLTRLEKEDEFGLGWEEFEHESDAMAILDMWNDDYSSSSLVSTPGWDWETSLGEDDNHY